MQQQRDVSENWRMVVWPVYAYAATPVDADLRCPSTLSCTAVMLGLRLLNKLSRL